MRVYKEKQYLVFDFENGKNVKYDFATKKSIGISGKQVCKLCDQLKGLTIDDILKCCDDKQYAKFLDFIRREERYPISNIGTILSRVPKYSNYEQIFSAGIEDIINSRSILKYTINEIPKSIIKVCKNHNGLKLSNEFISYWKENPDAHYLAYNLDYMSLNDEDIYSILISYYTGYCRNEMRYAPISYFNNLINVYGYNAKSLMLYLDRLKTYEALDNWSNVMRELHDYARMMNLISNKYDKFPRNLLTTHVIACRNYNRLKKEFNEQLFAKRINRDYECTFGEYKFFYPNSTQDIKDEAVMQNNCVASYIDRVIEGNCHILFLRKKDSPDKSLVTIEVRNNQIVQAKRKFNEDVNEEEQKAINAFNKKFINYKENVK